MLYLYLTSIVAAVFIFLKKKHYKRHVYSSQVYQDGKVGKTLAQKCICYSFFRKIIVTSEKSVERLGLVVLRILEIKSP